jgi:26S proteasome regulatory subunit N9
VRLRSKLYRLTMRVQLISLKLIRGSLDQVDQKAQISWVQPRVLSREQIGGLAQRLTTWTDKLGKVEKRIAPEVLASA